MNQIIKIGRWLKSIIEPSNQDLKIIALSVLGAAIIWLLSALNESYTTVINCPVKLSYEEEEAIVVKEPPEYIEANVTGIGWDLLKQSISFNKEPLELSVDNPFETRQISGYTIQPLLSQQLGPINLNFVVTDSITFNIQPVEHKKLTPKIKRSTLDLANNYEVVDSISVFPDTIMLSGPKSMVDTLSETLYISIPVEDIDENINQFFPITNFRKDLFSLIPNEIQVQMKVAYFVKAGKEFNIELVNFPMDSSIYVVPDRINIDFRIPEDSLDVFNQTDFMIIADYNNMNLLDSTVSLEVIETPSYVRNISLDTTQVKVIYAQ